jgi:hypothetical protein
MNDSKVILVQGTSSNWYEQAFFIVRPNMPESKIPIDLVSEAERIINNYVDNVPLEKKSALINNNVQKSKPSNNKTFDFYLNLIMLVACLVFLIVLIAYVT